MLGRILLAFALSLFAETGFLWAADSTFHHAKGFTILLPDGWESNNQAAGITISKGQASIAVMVIPGSGAPDDLIAVVAPQMAKQWRTFNEGKHSGCTVAGIHGACTWYSGINPKGVDTEMKVVALAQQGNGYLLFIESPRQNPAFARDLARIEQSFSVDTTGKATSNAAARPVDKQRLAALDQAYQDGQITTEEYERQKKQLENGEAPAAAGDGHQRPAGNRENSLASTEPPRQSPQQNLPQQNPAVPNKQSSGADQGQRFVSPDGFFATFIPSGWAPIPTGPVSKGAYYFAPLNGGSERIMIGSGPLFVTGIQQVVSSAVLSIATLYPGLRLAQRPAYSRYQGLPSAEFIMRGKLANGMPAVGWYGLVMAGRRYLYVFSMAPADSAARAEQDARSMFNHFQF